MLRYTPICSCSKCCFHHVCSVTRVQLVKRNAEIGMLLNKKENNANRGLRWGFEIWVQLVKRNAEIGMLLNKKENNANRGLRWRFEIWCTFYPTDWLNFSDFTLCLLKYKECMQAWKEENHSLECLSLFIVKATTLPQWHIFWPRIATKQLLQKKKSTGDSWVTQLVLCG